MADHDSNSTTGTTDPTIDSTTSSIESTEPSIDALILNHVIGLRVEETQQRNSFKQGHGFWWEEFAYIPVKHKGEAIPSLSRSRGNEYKHLKLEGLVEKQRFLLDLNQSGASIMQFKHHLMCAGSKELIQNMAPSCWLVNKNNSSKKMYRHYGFSEELEKLAFDLITEKLPNHACPQTSGDGYHFALFPFDTVRDVRMSKLSDLAIRLKLQEMAHATAVKTGSGK